MTHADQPARPAGDRALRLDEDTRTAVVSDHASDRPVPPGPLLFALTFALLVGGLWVMGIGFDAQSGLVFTAGLLLASLAFVIPLQATGR